MHIGRAEERRTGEHGEKNACESLTVMTVEPS